MRDSRLPGHRGWGDAVTGDAVTRFSPSVDVGTMPLAERCTEIVSH